MLACSTVEQLLLMINHFTPYAVAGNALDSSSCSGSHWYCSAAL